MSESTHQIDPDVQERIESDARQLAPELGYTDFWTVTEGDAGLTRLVLAFEDIPDEDFSDGLTDDGIQLLFENEYVVSGMRITSDGYDEARLLVILTPQYLL
jgi:hypothetical protein